VFCLIAVSLALVRVVQGFMLIILYTICLNKNNFTFLRQFCGRPAFALCHQINKKHTPDKGLNLCRECAAKRGLYDTYVLIQF